MVSAAMTAFLFRSLYLISILDCDACQPLTEGGSPERTSVLLGTVSY